MVAELPKNRRSKDAKKASKEAIVDAKALSFRGRTFSFFLPEKGNACP